MPMTNVTAKLRRNAARSPRRIAQTPNWQVNDADDQQDRRRPDQRQDVDVERWTRSRVIGGHCGALARTLK